ncbi:MAG: hypothetical protein JWM12_1373 [Ilumatobacteraceae bacterium]|nr:hypothetical protein [Ilumatobacteraceae bacterium]
MTDPVPTIETTDEPGTAEGFAAPRQRVLLGALYGLVAAALAAFGWFLASVGTKSQLVYLAVAIGVAVGYFVNVGARRGSALTSAVAVVITFVGCVTGFYFVSRSSLVRRGYVRLVGDDRSIPVRPSYQLVRDVLRVNLRSNVAPYLYLALALVAAAYFGLRGLDATKRRADH